MKKILSSIILASFALTACGEDSTPAVTQEQITPVVQEQAATLSPMSEKPSFSASRSVTIKATVDAINHATREVTLTREDGKTVNFVASEQARNLDQVQVGDIVVAEYTESLDIQVVTVENAQAEAANASMSARTKKGEMPGIASMTTTVVTATVEEINFENNTFKLKGPEGEIKEYTARNPENLKKASVGDLVVITYTEFMSFVVEATE